MDYRLFFPATERNKDCIGDVLSMNIPAKGSILEIASGSGEHGVLFQKRFPMINWQTSDPEASHRKSINAWIDHQGLKSIMSKPINLDVMKRPWPLPSEFVFTLKAVICINMIHISSWSCTEALFKESGCLLKKHQFLMLYGPFKKGGRHTSESNALFDQSLRMQNEAWGVRNLEEVNQTAITNGFNNGDVIQMPANNLSLIFRKR